MGLQSSRTFLDSEALKTLTQVICWTFPAFQQMKNKKGSWIMAKTLIVYTTFPQNTLNGYQLLKHLLIVVAHDLVCNMWETRSFFSVRPHFYLVNFMIFFPCHQSFHLICKLGLRNLSDESLVAFFRLNSCVWLLASWFLPLWTSLLPPPHSSSCHFFTLLSYPRPFSFLSSASLVLLSCSFLLSSSAFFNGCSSLLSIAPFFSANGLCCSLVCTPRRVCALADCPPWSTFSGSFLRAHDPCALCRTPWACSCCHVISTLLLARPGAMIDWLFVFGTCAGAEKPSIEHSNINNKFEWDTKIH